MTTRIIELFLQMASERNTQLIITSHESRLLAAEILRNDEICFILKNSDGESILNPLEKYQLRADKKVYAAMFDGTLKNVLPFYNKEKNTKYSCTRQNVNFFKQLMLRQCPYIKL